MAMKLMMLRMTRPFGDLGATGKAGGWVIAGREGGGSEGGLWKSNSPYSKNLTVITRALKKWRIRRRLRRDAMGN